jgi:phosphatidylglycerol:prolipoprotein diacylglycerol transferase
MYPELFQTKYFTINTLWVFFALGLIISIYAIIKLSTKNNLKIQFLSENSWKIIFWAIVGARIFSLIQNYQTYFYEFSVNTILQIFYIWDKGLNLYGAIIAVFISLFLLCKKNDQDFWKWLDTIVPAIILGFAIGHLGTFFEGINYGRETGLPWGVNFESPAIKYTVPIHPTQIYAFIYSLALGITLILVSRTEKITNLKKSGFIGIIGVAVYNFFQFLEQFVRGDDTFTIFGIRLQQIIALIIAISAGIFLYLHYNKRKFKKQKWNSSN